MTPDDLAAIRASVACDGLIDWPDTTIVLADALEQAWAERRAWWDQARTVTAMAMAERERAERAEADYRGLHELAVVWQADAERAEAERTVAWGELADQIMVAEREAHRALDAEAALARVRALCDEEEADETWGDERPWLLTSEIRAALDGEAGQPAEPRLCGRCMTPSPCKCYHSQECRHLRSDECICPPAARQEAGQ